ncbi:hypothetical protein B0I35DRAFT_452509 [Stachybotrys elegans]|uniref:HD domain-containing protein n=1 Tax=Stachybotrys elegans TaxID=80388 RepID=A0A8K0WPC5_9HYPO|nr:hypothetical protein B0I35DRAFT_452509 [Stachybotrys elegans]
MEHRTPTFADLPRRVIAGVSVVDTPIVREAQQYARDHSDDFLYNHIMRSWLFGALLLSHNETLSHIIDPEVQAVAILLHDLGLDMDPNSPHVSPDRRFEVDGAIAARSFIRTHRDGEHWEERRVQLVWDAIALHTDNRITRYKEPDVAIVTESIGMETTGPQYGVPEEEYNNVLAEFPPIGIPDSVITYMSWLCEHKPNTTYENIVQGYGDEFVEGYSAKGHRAVDVISGLHPVFK